MNTFVNHVVNLTTLEDEFCTLVEYIEHKYLNEITRSSKPNGGRSVKRGFLNTWTRKCMTLMQLLLQKLSKESGGGTYSLTFSQQSLL